MKRRHLSAALPLLATGMVSVRLGKAALPLRVELSIVPVPPSFFTAPPLAFARLPLKVTLVTASPP